MMMMRSEEEMKETMRRQRRILNEAQRYQEETEPAGWRPVVTETLVIVLLLALISVAVAASIHFLGPAVFPGGC